MYTISDLHFFFHNNKDGTSLKDVGQTALALSRYGREWKERLLTPLEIRIDDKETWSIRFN